MVRQPTSVPRPAAIPPTPQPAPRAPSLPVTGLAEVRGRNVPGWASTGATRNWLASSLDHDREAREIGSVMKPEFAEAGVGVALESRCLAPWRRGAILM
ncbi:uncharacterized protein LOC123427760 isoform X2 [Hordeum vulgare subsp. vulgare]|uniref:uncharacterized protein LOC123427760 isoform X2 n=1 Tax=Hordeum vulgare subsp. vulgare TaxID=112509 RepID=UPI001D1A3EE8|nr:uncharacterized protein LOC123427760 isoform X2 [Hordeum vulgare subsp. vulgare]